jgi:hypothetical protein
MVIAQSIRISDMGNGVCKEDQSMKRHTNYRKLSPSPKSPASSINLALSSRATKDVLSTTESSSSLTSTPAHLITKAQSIASAFAEFCVKA